MADVIVAANWAHAANYTFTFPAPAATASASD